jgi:branched-chain amino acid transport system permease protein
MIQIRVMHSTTSSRIGLTIVVAALLVLVAAPFWVDRASLRLLAEIYSYVALASLWNLLAGYAGAVSLGQQAYVGLGAYLLFGLTMRADVHPLLAIVFAAPAAGVLAVPVAALMFRLRRHSFAVGTWVVAEVFRLLAEQTPWLGAAAGESLPPKVVSFASHGTLIYWVALSQLAVIIVAIIMLLRSRYGLALIAIRSSELGARSYGVNAARIKFTIYVAAALASAMVGALIFLQKGQISAAAAFSVTDWTAFVIFITVIGGIGSVEGPIIGTVVFFALRQTLAGFGPIYLMILGVIVVAMIWKAPGGLWGLVADRFGWQVFPLQRRLVVSR